MLLVHGSSCHVITMSHNPFPEAPSYSELVYDCSCFCYSIKNSLAVLLEALFARIHFRFEILVFDEHTFCFTFSKEKI